MNRFNKSGGRKHATSRSNKKQSDHLLAAGGDSRLDRSQRSFTDLMHLSDIQSTDVHRMIEDLKSPERHAVVPKEIQDFGETYALSVNRIDRIVWLDNETDAFKRDARVEKLQNLGFTVEVIMNADKLKVVLSYALVITSPTYIEKIMRTTDIENNRNVVGILVLVEHDLLRNFMHLTKLKKVIDVFSNFEDIFYYIVMSVRWVVTRGAVLQ